MDRTVIRELWQQHRGKIVGAVIGFAFGLLIRWVGLGWALLILALTTVGYWIGRRFDEDDEALAEWIERMTTRPRGG